MRWKVLGTLHFNNDTLKRHLPSERVLLWFCYLIKLSDFVVSQAKYFFFEGLFPTENSELDAILEESSPSLTTVKTRVAGCWGFWKSKIHHNRRSHPKSLQKHHEWAPNETDGRGSDCWRKERGWESSQQGGRRICWLWSNVWFSTGPTQQTFCGDGQVLDSPLYNNQNSGGKKELTPKKSISSAEKVMVAIFWDAKGILLVDYLENSRTSWNKKSKKKFR